MLLVLLLLHVFCDGIRWSDDIHLKGEKENQRACINVSSTFHKITLEIPVSINRESIEGLTAVPGIGPKIAYSIVRERGKRSGFKSLDEIKSVRGIGPALYAKIKPYIGL